MKTRYIQYICLDFMPIKSYLASSPYRNVFHYHDIIWRVLSEDHSFSGVVFGCSKEELEQTVAVLGETCEEPVASRANNSQMAELLAC
ncbi:MAG: hypothetical protein KJ630_17925 [Proteobacteria bacterium]|nr:hypothetical protein [Pseudomonadota bacterium]